ncbi:hypothetical protein WDU94_001757 [Cyamophila willieti]
MTSSNSTIQTNPLSKEVERKFLREFLALYKSLPELWNTNSEEYKDRWRKSQGYEILVTKYKELYPTATRDDVTKRLNCLRTNYRKERRRIRNITEQLGHEYEVQSNVWYYHDLKFLDDLEVSSSNKSELRMFAESLMTNNTSSNMSTSQGGGDTSLCGGEMGEEVDNEMRRRRRSLLMMDMRDLSNPTSRLKKNKSNRRRPLSGNVTPVQRGPTRAIRVIRVNIPRKWRTKTEYRGRVEPSQRAMPEERIDFDRQAIKWTTELALMSKEQQIHAKKYMNEILYEGAFGNLLYNSFRYLPGPSQEPMRQLPVNPPTSSQQLKIVNQTDKKQNETNKEGDTNPAVVKTEQTPVGELK